MAAMKQATRIIDVPVIFSTLGPEPCVPARSGHANHPPQAVSRQYGGDNLFIIQFGLPEQLQASMIIEPDCRPGCR